MNAHLAYKKDVCVARAEHVQIGTWGTCDIWPEFFMANEMCWMYLEVTCDGTY
jgi:hypothetical protein